MNRTSLPAGITIRQVGEPNTRKHSLLDRAAACNDVEEAARMIADALGLDPKSALARINLSKPYRWAQFSPAGRLAEIASWLHAEAFEAMDFIEGDAPMQTVKTND